MTYEYLVASLPLLSMNTPPPCSAEEFLKQCAGVLSPEDAVELDLLLSGRGDEGLSAFSRNWQAGDTQLRNDIAQRRANAKDIEARPYIHPYGQHRVWLEHRVNDAFSRRNPMERERILDQARWDLLDELAGDDPFGVGRVFAHALQCRLCTRWASLTKTKGEEVFKDMIKANLTRQTDVREFDVDVLDEFSRSPASINTRTALVNKE